MLGILPGAPRPRHRACFGSETRSPALCRGRRALHNAPIRLKLGERALHIYANRFTVLLFLEIAQGINAEPLSGFRLENGCILAASEAAPRSTGLGTSSNLVAMAHPHAIMRTKSLGEGGEAMRT
jgi:hypothetical protein